MSIQNAILGIIASSAVCIFSLCGSNKLNGKETCIIQEYQPSAKLLQLLQLVGMSPPDPSRNALEQINDWAQKHLLRQGERWETQTDKFEFLKPQLIPLLQELGLFDPVHPHFKAYQGAIIHGSTLGTARLRLNYLVEQWREGIGFSHLYFLTGERPLNPEEKDAIHVVSGKLPETEYEMVQLLWEHSDIPQTLRSQVQVHFITAPMQRDLQGNPLRPTTQDTVNAWLKAAPPIGSYLVISNAPYTPRQHFVLKTAASHEYSFDTVGPGASENEKAAIFLDELARLIFQIKNSFN